MARRSDDKSPSLPHNSPMLPVVLHHGFFGVMNFHLGPVNIGYFAGIDRAIVERGRRVMVPRVHPTGSIARRASQLKESILRQLEIWGPPDQKLLVIAHSMGGLDGRYMITKLGMADRIAALVTISTPHRGSPYADWCARNLGKRLGMFRLMKLLRLDVDGVMDLTTERCRRFNEEVPDMPGVRYFSISASRPWHRVPAFAMQAHKVVYDAEGDNDSLVSIKSARWGEYLGNWPADHWHTINKRFVLELHEPTGEITPYYLKLIDDVTGRLETPVEAATSA